MTDHLDHFDRLVDAARGSGLRPRPRYRYAPDVQRDATVPLDHPTPPTPPARDSRPPLAADVVAWPAEDVTSPETANERPPRPVAAGTGDAAGHGDREARARPQAESIDRGPALPSRPASEQPARTGKTTFTGARPGSETAPGPLDRDAPEPTPAAALSPPIAPAADPPPAQASPAQAQHAARHIARPDVVTAKSAPADGAEHAHPPRPEDHAAGHASPVDHGETTTADERRSPTEDAVEESSRPVVRVTIGRIDVRPAPSDRSARAQRRRPEPAVPLDDYLREQR